MRLLLVEDDAMLAAGLLRALQAEGYTVDHVDRGELVLEAVRLGGFELLLLDLGLPGMDGMAVLSALRQINRQLPVIIITARDQLDDRLLGLDAGADDYLIKPFAASELIARIRARLRRRTEQASSVLHFADLDIDPERFSVTKAGRRVSLSRREMGVLFQLVRSPGRVFTREQLEQGLYGWSDDIESNALEVHVHHLRKKLGGAVIRTVRGVGYSFVGGDEH